MLNVRVIPVLLLSEEGLVKGEGFKKHRYIGDPINAVKIFNEKESDELVFLDIEATKKKRDPNFQLIRDIASEAFMPFSYGGGIHHLDQAKKIFDLGVEKIVVNTAAFENPKLISEVAQIYGSQSVVVSIDVRDNFLGGKEVYVYCAEQRTKISPVEYAIRAQDFGAGELIVTSVSREGSSKGYDLELLKEVSSAVEIPVVAQGGASKLEDFSLAVKESGVSGVAAGSMFVFHGKHKAVLITYPTYSQLKKIFED